MLSFIVLLNTLLRGKEVDTLKYKSIQPDDFQAMISSEKKAVLIDVREYDEFRIMRLKKAINIPVTTDLGRLADTLNKETILLLYCQRGKRSARAAVKLYDLGFHNLYSLEGGIEKWKKEGFPVIKKRLKKR